MQNGKDCGTTISWSPATSGQFASTYNIQRSTTNTTSSFVTIANVLYRTPSYTDTNLINGKTYWYRVSAVNEFGQSTATGAVSVVPNSPGDGNVAVPVLFDFASILAEGPQSAGEARFHWMNSSTAFNYIGSLIEYMEQMPDGSYASPSITGYGWVVNQWARFQMGDRWQYDPNMPKNYYMSSAPSQNTGANFAPSRGNVNYRFRIRNFTHPGSDYNVYHYSSALTRDVTLPGDESRLNGAAPVFVPSLCYQDNPESILLTWKYYPTVPDYTTFTVYYKIGSGSWMTTNAYSSYSISVPVGSNKTVTFYIRANYSKDGVLLDGPYSSSITLSTNNQVATPTYLYLYTTWGNKIQLSWNNNSMNNPTFSIDRKVGTGSWVVNAFTTGTGVTYYDNTGLTPGTQYSYRVRALYNGVYSAYSPVVTAMTWSATAQSITTGYDANKAIDGNLSSQWLASATTRPQWWQVNLNASKTIWSITIKWTTAAAWKYRIDGSTNGTTWTTTPIVDQRNRTNTSQTTTDYPTASDPWKYLKVTVTGGPSGVKAGLYDFTIYSN